MVSAAVQEYCATESFNATCNPDEVIIIKSALYGRMHLGRCVEGDFGYIGCSVDVLSVLDRMCSGRRTCQFQVPLAEFDALRPCVPDLTSYLEADFECVQVTQPGHLPGSQTHTTVTSPHGYLAGVNATSFSFGLYVIEAPSGTRINLTLHEFFLETTPQNLQICIVYAIVKDLSTQHSVTICSNHQRQSHVYTSLGNRIEVRIVTGHSDQRHFLIEYSVIGCGDLPDPENGYAKRHDDIMKFGCHTNDQTWFQKCIGGVWKGDTLRCPVAAVRETQEYCASESFNATCNPDEVIIIKSALYGRMHLGRCIEGDFGYIGCSVDVLSVLDRMCSGRRTCQFQVPLAEFDALRPCVPDLTSYLEAHFECVQDRPSRSFCGDAVTDLLDEDPIRCKDQDILIHAIKAFVSKPNKKNKCPKGATDAWKTKLPNWTECFHRDSFEWCQFESCSPMDIMKVFGFRKVQELCEDYDSDQSGAVLVRVQYTCAKVDTRLCSATSSPFLLSSSELLRLPPNFRPKDSCTCVLTVSRGVTVSLQTMYSTRTECLEVRVNNKNISLAAMGTMTSCFDEEISAEFSLSPCSTKTPPDFWLAHSSVTGLEIKCSRIMHEPTTPLPSSTDAIPTSTRAPTEPKEPPRSTPGGRMRTTQATSMPRRGEKEQTLDSESIIGIAVAAFLLVLSGAAIAVCFVFKRRRRQTLKEEANRSREQETYSTLDLPETKRTDYENLGKSSATRRPLPNPGVGGNKYEQQSRNAAKIGKDNQSFDVVKDDNNYEGLRITPELTTIVNGYVVYNGDQARYDGGRVEKECDDDDYENIFDYVHDYD
ncbi:hypothetical protein CAPTEDRAFT_216978 [Capitella teleta]|uniref:SUEL-type lectin domain-containing protein n=1 Tax=Capitella teleta TaxID=283909 RepID=R7T571_CAPTE|nr:hypothetical protein CAPTEDRAFT_216978 [Capitella teleta]|eukprot:ELT88188.1 hypothetical protein CAPTEDRAFT_216978 [Capitella teleta]